MEVLNRLGHRWGDIAQSHADGHRAEDPDGEVLVEEVHRPWVTTLRTRAVRAVLVVDVTHYSRSRRGQSQG